MPRKTTGRKPGRPPRAGGTSQYSIRMGADLRKKLDRAAKLNDRSLRAEIERRIASSFGEAMKTHGHFGGPDNYGLLFAFGEILRRIEGHASGDNLAIVPGSQRTPENRSPIEHRWFNDPYVADQVKRGFVELINLWGASGEAVSPDTLDGWYKDRPYDLGATIARSVAQSPPLVAPERLEDFAETGIHGEHRSAGAKLAGHIAFLMKDAFVEVRRRNQRDRGEST
jgi:hypothetical protein